VAYVKERSAPSLKSNIVIKSYQNGISLYLDTQIDFEQILEEIRYKFSESRAFFGTARVALSLEGRKLSHGEELRVLEVIQESSDVEVVCIVGKDEETDKLYLKALQQTERKLSEDDEGRFYRGTLKNREMLEAESSVIILGDVNPGSTVISAKNIIILGGLYGEAYAGGNGEDGSYIVALEMEPERLIIGDFKYKRSAKTSKWGIRPKVQPKIACVKNERIVFEPLTKDLLGDF
jgi:septum site-determining protein MinC